MFFNSKLIDNPFACRMIFFVVAFYVGLWTIRIPTIKDQVGTDYLGIGYILAHQGPIFSVAWCPYL